MIVKKTTQELAIVALLDRNVTFRLDWIQPPQVAHIPFMGSRKSFFLLVNVHVRPEANSKEKLVAACFATAQSIISSGLLADERAVEISAFADALGHKNLKRVFRLTVLDTAFAEAMHIVTEDLLNKQPSGITCQWPLKP